jgi:cell division protein FtsQ
MRSVKIDRKASQPRAARSGRGNGRASRPQPSGKPFGKRKPLATNIVARSFRAVRSWFALHRLMFTMTAIFMAFVFVAALFIGGTVGRTVRAVNNGVAALIADAGFGIAQVHLTGNKRTPTESIMAALNLHRGQPIFGAGIRDARARVMQLPWVADAEVRRRYPDDISVRIIEKLPYALWQAPDMKVWVVERDGGLITTEGIREFRRLPVLLGAGGASAADIVEAVAGHRAISARVRAYQRVGERRWNLILDDGVIVQLPEANWAGELDALEHLIIDKGILERDVVQIDLRAPAQYVFTLKTGEKTTNVPKGNGA